MDDAYAINLAKTELREGFNSGDVGRVLGVFADEFTDMTEGRPTFWGADSKTVLKAILEKLFREQEVELTPIVINFFIAADFAFEYGWHEIKSRPKAGGPSDFKRTRYAEVWKRAATGEWKIILTIDNVDQTPLLAENIRLASA
jgi:ketosteroid isomerase-like protein